MDASGELVIVNVAIEHVGEVGAKGGRIEIQVVEVVRVVLAVGH